MDTWVTDRDCDYNFDRRAEAKPPMWPSRDDVVDDGWDHSRDAMDARDLGRPRSVGQVRDPPPPTYSIGANADK